MLNISRKIYCVALLILSSMFLAQCSLRSIGLKYGDFFIARYLSSSFDLETSQYQTLKADIDLNWNQLRRDFLPPIIADLRTVHQMFDRGVVDEDLRWMSEKIDSWLEKIGLWLAPVAADFFLGLSEKQYETWQKSFLDRNEELIKRLALKDPEFVEKRQQDYVDRFETWFGSMEKWQRLPLLAIFAPSRERDQFFWDMREMRFQGFLTEIKEIKEKDAMAKVIIAYAKNPDNYLTSEMAARSKQERMELFHKVKSLMGHITEKQKRHGLDYLNALILDLEGIVLKPEGVMR